MTGAHLVRAVWSRCVGVDPFPKSAIGVADVGKGLLAHHATVLLDKLEQSGFSTELLTRAQIGLPAAYPATCLRLLELFGLAGLASDDSEEVMGFSAACARLVQSELGASHPISDHWAVCVVPPALLLWNHDRDLLGNWLQQTCVWLVDRFEEGVGLAPPWSDPAEEINQLFGSAFEHVTVARSPGSLLASVLLDIEIVASRCFFASWQGSE